MTITNADVTRFLKLKSTIETATTELDELKRKMRDSLEIGQPYETGNAKITVRPGRRRLDNVLARTYFPYESNPEMYSIEPNGKAIKTLVSESDWEQVTKEDSPAVYVTPKVAK